MKQKLTVRTVEAVEPGAVCWDNEIPGFGLRVTPKGKRSFFLYYRTADHTQRRPLIGTYPAMRPEQAREIAKDWQAEVRKGGDPSKERQQARASRGKGTVKELFEDYKREKASLRSIGEISRIFEQDILPTLGKLRAESVTRSDVTRLLDKLSVRSRTVASNARKRLSAFYSWAMPRLPDEASNPVREAVAAPPPAARERVLSGAELKALWEVLETEPEPWRTGLRLLILTGQRRGEVFGASWSEFDMEQGLWTIPADRAKNGKAHIVPLSPQVLALLKERPRSGRVFFRREDAARFMKLCGCSNREAEGARWTEIDLEAGLWRLSKKRSSSGKAVEITLPDKARMFLSGLDCAGMVFPGDNRAFSRVALRIRTALDKKLETPSEPWSWHDIRRTVATGLQRLGVRLEVTEAILNHVSGSRAGIVGVYQRYDWLKEKRDALNLWANEVLVVKPAGKVVSFRR